MAVWVAALAMAGAMAGGPADWPGVWNSDPTAVPSSKTVDGPLLGDGETGVVLGSSSAALSAYISANSFWVLNKDNIPHGQGSHRAVSGPHI
jgi:hypothetical protein